MIRPIRAAAALAMSAGLVFTLAAPAAASTSPGLEDKRDALLAAHNKARADKCGSAGVLKRGPNIEDAALYHAKDMADENYTGHNSQNPFVYWDVRIDRYINRPVGGENLAYGYSTVSGAMQGWRESSGHWRNVMDCSFEYVGFGYAYRSASTYDHYWVADFSY